MLHGGVFSISGSEAVVDCLSAVLSEHHSDSDTEQKAVGELATWHLVVNTSAVDSMQFSGEMLHYDDLPLSKC